VRVRGLGCDFETKRARSATVMLRDLGFIGVKDRVRISRTYAGFHQRSTGIWSWVAEKEDGGATIGSQFPLSVILKSYRDGLLSSSVTDWSDRHLYPESKPENAIHD